MKIYHASNLIDAQIVKDQLKIAGIKCKIINTQAHSLRGPGFLPFTTDSLPTLVLLNTEDKEQALKIIAEHESQKNKEDTSHDWACPHCQNENPGNFSICWNCQTSPETLTQRTKQEDLKKESPIKTPIYRTFPFLFFLVLATLIWILLKDA